MKQLAMRPTRVIYVENDPALRNLLGAMLSASPELEMIGSFGNGEEALDRNLIKKADVALIDFALNQNGLNGIELGIAIRNINEYIGVVIYSQNSVYGLARRVPKEMRSGWSFFNKSATMGVLDYQSILKMTSRGKGNWEKILELNSESSNNDSGFLDELSPRQRSILSMTTKGLEAREIATQLGLSYSHIRKELSRAYAIILAGEDKTRNMKTAAVLRYLDVVRNVE